ncbi:Cys-tRNA(Pro) deacylase [Bdellovibrio sp. HCB185ZH]|uniref:Cys-tRNA(Pro) deacylase n=1 Tax=Bdellovibrio sp. HCB185ZH TaxID=3394235 RepID=UPI0039A48DA8
MSQQEKPPMTLALRELEKHGVELTYHLFTYQEKGGTAHSSKEMGVDEHAVIKTLIMEDENKEPLIVLMHGDMQVSTKNLARTLGKKSINPCKPEVADRHSGYQVGGTSPFGTKKKMPVYMEETILTLPKIYINGGKRGFLVGMDPKQAEKILTPKLVNVGIKG